MILAADAHHLSGPGNLVTSRRLFISGRVQGVGFRFSLANEARQLGLSGWVRNLQDGRVEALLCGPHEAVDRLTRWADHGPTLARVNHVCAVDLDADDPESCVEGFEQRATR